ncbi:MAG: hypothetical protein HS116_22205 [Planctomycetes bacterium]|nr:hypothetical protein [Planctomycetota bacterium]
MRVRELGLLALIFALASARAQETSAVASAPLLRFELKDRRLQLAPWSAEQAKDPGAALKAWVHAGEGQAELGEERLGNKSLIVSARSDRHEYVLEVESNASGIRLQRNALGETVSQWCIDASSARHGRILLLIGLPGQKRHAVYEEGQGLTLVTEGQEERFEAPDFQTLLMRDTARVQVNLLRPFTDAGIGLAPNAYWPPAMAIAVTGFAPPAPELAPRLEALIQRLQSEKGEDRDAATAELIKLYPLGVKFLDDAAAKADAPESKIRLQRVLAAHPTIQQLKPWVAEQKLHENRAYLMDLFVNAPLFKTAVRVRLAELLGKDYGDDPAAWPKPE